MWEEYKTIIVGIVGGVIGTILYFNFRREVAWTFLLLFPIFSVILRLIFNKKGGAKKEGAVQQKE